MQTFNVVSLVEYLIRRSTSFFVLDFCSHRKIIWKRCLQNGAYFVSALLCWSFMSFRTSSRKYPTRVLNQFSWFNALFSHAIYKSLKFRLIWSSVLWFACQCSSNTLRPRQNDLFRDISWMKMYEFRLKFHWIVFLKVKLTGVKPLPEPTVISLLAHICVIRPQWINVQSSTAHSVKPAKIGSDSCADPTLRIT